MADQTNNRKMSRAEAGRKGGQTTKQRYGSEASPPSPAVSPGANPLPKTSPNVVL